MEQIVRNHFKKLRRNVNKVDEIVANVKVVLCDLIKPAFLYDISGCERKTLTSFVHEINLANLGPKLCLICIDGCHFFITNANAAQKAIEAALDDKLFFIDIGQDNPKVLRQVSDDPNLKHMLTIVFEKLQIREERCEILPKYTFILYLGS